MNAVDGRPKIVVVQGATACGKTALAIKIAKVYMGEIINADSLQMVKGFDIGTAKPDLAELAEAKHHLIDVVLPNEKNDAAEYVKLAKAAISDILKAGKLPIIAGGTGLYVRALLGGLVDLPAADLSLRAGYEDFLEKHGRVALADKLLKLDNQAKHKTDLQNPRRVIRALEVLELTGKPIWKWQEEHNFKERPYNSFRIAIKPDMEKLTKRIELRSRLMLEHGFIDEVKALLKTYSDKSLKPFEAIGYSQVIDFLDAKISAEELPIKISQATRRYAKKQIRWLNTEKDINWIEQTDFEVFADSSIVDSSIVDSLREFLDV